MKATSRLNDHTRMKEYHYISLVAGGAGFIGSHLCRRLLHEGRLVVCIDNLQTGDLRNIQPLIEHPLFQFVNHDIVEPYTDLERIDEIYNLACPASPIHYQDDPIHTTETCVIGMLNLLRLAQKHNCPILQASTSEVYGDASMHPQKEDYWGNVNPIGLRSCYDIGKRCAESLCMDFYRKHGMKVKIIRIFNTYGPRMAIGDGRVVSNFIVQALRGEPITIYGDGSHTRSFQYVDDLIKGMMRMMQTDNDFTGPFTGIFTIIGKILPTMLFKRSAVIRLPTKLIKCRMSMTHTIASPTLRWRRPHSVGSLWFLWMKG